jgi:hypothetical protein
VYEGGQISAVVKNEVESLATLKGGELLLEAPLVLLFSLTLPGKAVALSVCCLYDMKKMYTYTGTPVAAIAAAA